MPLPRTIIRAACVAGLSLVLLQAADHPAAEIANGQIRAKIYLPDAKNGFYRGTRFDWSGVIYSLQYKSHDYYGPWFDRIVPKVHDFIYEGPAIVAGACSAITGPVDEFQQIGWEEAKPGANFIKIGVGVLRKPDDSKYDNYRLYDLAVPGKWTVRTSSDSVEFIQEAADPSSGYGYTYRKTVRLAQGKPEMILEHSLKNTGIRGIHTTVYNHNFLVLDKQPPGPGLAITVPFQIRTPKPPPKDLAEIQGNKIVYMKALANRDVVTTPVQGFGDSPNDHEIRIEDRRVGAGMRISTDRPLSTESLWSIRTVVAMEPFVAIGAEPGKEFTWTTTYDYYTLPGKEE